MSTQDAMVRLAEQWETMAENLSDAVSAPQHPNVLDALRMCAAELRRTLDVDPLRHIEVGDPAPLFDGPYCGMGWCTRQPHPDHWQHIVGDDGWVLAVWTDEPQPGSADS